MLAASNPHAQQLCSCRLLGPPRQHSPTHEALFTGRTFLKSWSVGRRVWALTSLVDTEQSETTAPTQRDSTGCTMLLGRTAEQGLASTSGRRCCPHCSCLPRQAQSPQLFSARAWQPDTGARCRRTAVQYAQQLADFTPAQQAQVQPPAVLLLSALAWQP